MIEIPLSGCAPAYSASVQIGGQSFRLWADTGSATTAVSAAACACGTLSVYRPGADAVDQGTRVSASYGGQRGWQGAAWEDSFEPTGAPAVRMRLVAIDQHRSFFPIANCEGGSGPQGIWGLGPAINAHAGTDGYLDRLHLTAGLADVFAVKLCEPGGTLWLGGYAPEATTGPPQYTPLLEATPTVPHYAVFLAGIAVDGAQIAAPAGPYGPAIIDTGSPLIGLPTSVFTAVVAAISASQSFTQVFGGPTWFDGYQRCVRTEVIGRTEAELDAMLPPLTLTFGQDPATAVSLRLPATQSYVYKILDDSGGGPYYCPGIGDDRQSLASPSAFVLGDAVLHGSVTIFDRAQRRVGFAPAQGCP